MKNLYIGNIPEEVTDEFLFDAICARVKVKEAKVFKERYSERPLGFGFITIEDKSEKSVKEKLYGFNLLGKKIILE